MVFQKISIIWLAVLLSMGLQKAIAQNLSRDELDSRINLLEKQKPSLQRDSTLAFYYNDMCEKCVYANDSRAEEFLIRFEKRYKALSENWKPAEALFYRAKGKSIEKKGDYTQAIELYYKAIKILEANPCEPKHLTYSYIMAGFVMTNNHNIEECVRLFKKAEPFALKEKNKANIIWIYDYFGDIAYDFAKNTDDYKRALSYYKKVEQFLPESNIPNQKSNNLEGLGKAYWKLGNKKLAYSYFDKALTAANKRKVGEGFSLWNIYSHLSSFKEEENKIDEAIFNALKSLEAAENHGYAEFILRSHNDLYRLYKKKGDQTNALLNYEKYNTLNDSLGRNELNAKYKELETKYNSEIQANKIEKLENSRLQSIGYVILGIMVFGLISLLYYSRVNKKLKAQNLLLNAKNEEIKQAVLVGSQQERKRVANDLHDGLATKISAMKWRIEAEDPQNVNKKIVEELEKLYTDVRLIAHNMAAYEFHAVGLINSIEGLLSKLNLIDKTKFNFENKLSPDLDINYNLEYQLYCIALELSTNILKHSNAETAVLTMKEFNKSIIMVMSDNGSKRALKKGGIGLKSLKDRLAVVNGKTVIRDEDGFEVYIEVPLT